MNTDERMAEISQQVELPLGGASRKKPGRVIRRWIDSSSDRDIEVTISVEDEPTEPSIAPRSTGGRVAPGRERNDPETSEAFTPYTGPIHWQPFTPEQHRQFAAHLLRVNARETCPACDVDRWQLFLAGRLVERTCQHCGLIMHFRAAVIGIEQSRMQTYVHGGGNQYVAGVEARKDGKEQ